MKPRKSLEGLPVDGVVYVRETKKGRNEMSSMPMASSPRSSGGLAVVGVSVLAVSAVLNSGIACLAGRLAERGEFELPSKRGFLEELRTIVADSNFTNCRFSANHASNHLSIRGRMPEDKEGLVSLLEQVLATRDERPPKPEFLRGL